MYRDVTQETADCVVSDFLNIGVYICSTDEFALIPMGVFIEKDKRVIERALRVPLRESMIGGTNLLGVLTVANSNGILLPGNLVTDLEVEELKIQYGDKVDVLDSKITALGNVMAVNNNGALVSSEFTKKDITKIEDVLGVPVVKRDISGLSIVGSMCIITSRGALVSPLASDEEIEEIASIFGVNAEICTVNRGYAFISSGLVANAKGALCGLDTTGIERARIINTLF
jgi:translation initiation factor 6